MDILADLLADLEVGDWVLVKPMGIDMGCPFCYHQFGCFGLREAEWGRVEAFIEAERETYCTACGAVIQMVEGRIRLDIGVEVPYTWIQEIRREDTDGSR